MAYNHGREDRKWRIWKEAEEKLLRECGVDEATIEQIRMADRADFNSNRRFYRWTNDVAEYLEDIYDIIWNEPYSGDYNVVMRHICNIREKIEDDPGHPVYIQTVRGVGYRFNGNLGSE